MNLPKLLSPKVLVGTGGAGLSAVISHFLLWIIGASLFGVGYSAANQDVAIAAVPEAVATLLVTILALAFTFIPAWLVTDPARFNLAALDTDGFEGPGTETNNIETELNDEDYEPSETEPEVESPEILVQVVTAPGVVQPEEQTTISSSTV